MTPIFPIQSLHPFGLFRRSLFNFTRNAFRFQFSRSADCTSNAFGFTIRPMMLMLSTRVLRSSRLLSAKYQKTTAVNGKRRFSYVYTLDIGASNRPFSHFDRRPEPSREVLDPGQRRIQNQTGTSVLNARMFGGGRKHG